MVWNGFFSYDGTEVINVERTAAYALAGGAHWFLDTYKSEHLHNLLGEHKYRSPFQDHSAPWVDKDVPDSYGFYGVYPLDITGVDDSTRSSVVVENTRDGGEAGRLRHGTRQMVFTCLLLGRDDAAVDAGMSWLRAVLLASCPGLNYGGAPLCFYAAEPPFQPGQDDCGDEYLRTLLQVTINNGPTVTEKHVFGDGSAVWTVSFTAVANIPWHYGIEQPVVQSFLQSANPNVAGGYFDDTGHVFTDVDCLRPTYHPVFDPACPDLILPPSVPRIRFGCFDKPVSWKRYRFDIPADLIREWTESVPIIHIAHGQNLPLHNIRMRIYADPDGTFDPDDDPCSHCADFWITYIPELSSLHIDSRDQTITVLSAGQERRADSVVYDSNHTPFIWPRLSCGIGYVVTVDFEQTTRQPAVDFSLVPRFK